MAGLLDLSRNYSYFAIPAALVVAFGPKIYGQAVGGGKCYDVAKPRQYLETVNKDESLDKRTKELLHRCEAAHSNNMETLPMFAAGLVAANSAGVPAEAVNTWALAYLGFRVLYNTTYVFVQENKKLAPLRSLCWISGSLTWLTLFVKAGYKLLEASQ